jgi:hypothetical protein
MINEKYLEKYCIDEIIKCGKILRDESINKDVRYSQEFRLDAFTEILAIIAKEIAYENNQAVK